MICWQRLSIFATLFWVLMIAGIAQVMTVVPEQEPNNSLETPQVISAQVGPFNGFVVWQASIIPAGDADYYRFEVTTPGVYSIRVDSTRDPVLLLYDSLTFLIDANDNSGNPDTPNSLDSGLTRFLDSGVYFIQVRYAIPTGTARYALRVFPGFVAPDFDPTEPNGPNNPVQLGSFQDGSLTAPGYGFLSYGGGDEDYFRVTVTRPGLNLYFQTITCVDTVIEVIRPDGQRIENDDADWDPLNGRASQVEIQNAPVGVYLIAVKGYSGWGGYYNLRLFASLANQFTLSKQNVSYTQREINVDSTQANNGLVDFSFSGRDFGFQDWWWYRVEGLNAREFALTGLTGLTQIGSDRIELLYTLPEGLRVTLEYILRPLNETQAIVEQHLTVTNPTSITRSIHFFKYTDYDMFGTPADDTLTWSPPDRLLYQDSATTNFGNVVGLPRPIAFETQVWPGLRDNLANSVLNNLSNQLPFITGDVTGAMQWRCVVPPGQSSRLIAFIAMNTDVTLLEGDMDGDGCVSDEDLLRVLFEFGRQGSMLEDINGDLTVNDEDLLLVLENFSNGCLP